MKVHKFTKKDKFTHAHTPHSDKFEVNSGSHDVFHEAIIRLTSTNS